MEVLIACMLGLIVGCVVTVIVTRIRSIGSLRIDYSDPDDGPYLWLELTSRPANFEHKKFVMLRVKAEDYISRK